MPRCAWRWTAWGDVKALAKAVDAVARWRLSWRGVRWRIEGYGDLELLAEDIERLMGVA